MRKKINRTMDQEEVQAEQMSPRSEEVQAEQTSPRSEEVQAEIRELNHELAERLEKETLLIGKGSRRSRNRQKTPSGNKILENKRKKNRGLCIAGIAGSCLVVLVAAAGVGLYAMHLKGEKSLTSHEGVANVEITAPEEVVVEEKGQQVTYNGVTYQRNENVISILCMGVDKEELEVEGQVAGEGGQADTIFVVALDAETGGMRLVNISRDSMTEVEVYNVDNEYVGTDVMQLCLAYAYGDGKETSCENTIKSVSRLLYGMPIDAYAAIDMPAINVLNDAVGGVEVEVLEDLSRYYPSMVPGNTVLLQGEMAETYVRSRWQWTLDSNNARIARQKQYLTNFISKAISATREDITVPLTLYQSVIPYMVTDIDASEVTYLASLVLKGNLGLQDIINVPGEVVKGEEYAEYHIDEKALYEIILDVFYQPVEA